MKFRMFLKSIGQKICHRARNLFYIDYDASVKRMADMLEKVAAGCFLAAFIQDMSIAFLIGLINFTMSIIISSFKVRK